jgi:uncharacterized protein YtpQ (UPF0354 family)
MDSKISSNAVAYLKPDVSYEVSEPDLELSRDDSPVLRNIGNGLLVAYLIDEGDYFRYIQQKDIDEDGISEDELHKIGLTNLFDLVEGNLEVQNYDDIYVVNLDGNFEASLILLDQLWDISFRDFFPGDYVVAIPARDVLSFCDYSFSEGRQKLKAVIDRVTAGGDHLLSDRLLKRVGCSWEAIVD